MQNTLCVIFSSCKEHTVIFKSFLKVLNYAESKKNAAQRQLFPSLKESLDNGFRRLQKCANDVIKAEGSFILTWRDFCKK